MHTPRFSSSYQYECIDSQFRYGVQSSYGIHSTLSISNCRALEKRVGLQCCSRPYCLLGTLLTAGHCFSCSPGVDISQSSTLSRTPTEGKPEGRSERYMLLAWVNTCWVLGTTVCDTLCKIRLDHGQITSVHRVFTSIQMLF